MGQLFETPDRNLAEPDFYNGVIASVHRDTPLQALLKKTTKPINWTESVEVQRIPTPHNAAVAEGTDYTKTPGKYTNLELQHELEVFRSEGYGLSRQTMLMPGHNHKGSKGELARQKLEDAQELAFSIENAICSAQEAVLRGSGNDTIAKTRGVMSWLAKLATRTAAAAGTLHPVQTIPFQLCPSVGYDADVTALSEATFKDLVKGCAKDLNGNVNLVGLVGIDLKAVMSDWLAKATVTQSAENLIRVNRSASDKKLSLIVDFFEYVGGVVRTVTSQHMNADTTTNVVGAAGSLSGAFINTSMWGIESLDPMHDHPLTDNGAGNRGFYEATLRLACYNPMAQFRITHVTA